MTPILSSVGVSGNPGAVQSNIKDLVSAFHGREIRVFLSFKMVILIIALFGDISGKCQFVRPLFFVTLSAV
jgi:hypothetical protein